MTADTLARQVAHIERALSVFHPGAGAGGAVELRALNVGGKRAVCSIHADMGELARRAADLDEQGASGCYFTLNPLRPDLVGSRASCKKADVIERHWLPLDIDPYRPKDCSSTEAELEAAWAVLDRCRGVLADLAGAVVGCSGNGWHLCYPVLLPNDELSQALLKDVLAHLHASCGAELSADEKAALERGEALGVPKAKVEKDVHDAPRIWKQYGTRARKGTHTPERPHRWARLVEGESWERAAAQRNAGALHEMLARWRFAEDTRRGRTPEASGSLAERARRYVAKMPPAISGQKGHDATFEVAQALARGFSLPRSESWPILCEYNLRCVPPWSEADLLHKIESAEADSRLPAGYLAAAAGTPATNGAGHGRLSILTAVEPPPDSLSESPPPFPLDVLPPMLARFVREGSLALCCPPDYIAVPLLVAAGSAIGASRALRLTSHWWVFPALYACVVAPPGSAKSPAASRALSAVRQQQRCNYQFFKRRLREWEQEDIEERGERPVFVRAYTSDVTTEKLVAILSESPRGLLYHRDELLSWVGSMDQYRDAGKGADRQVYMALWDHSSVSIERKCHDDGLPVTVHRPYLSVFGTIQPDVVHRLTREGEQDGFVERILYSYPEPAPGSRVWRWDDISSEAQRAWDLAMSLLYALDMAASLDTDADGDEPAPRFLQFSAAGAAAWESWYAVHQGEVPELPPVMLAYHAKLESACARLALLLELLWRACQSSDTFFADAAPDVGADAVRMAGQLAAYFLGHARRAYGCLTRKPSDRRAEVAAAWIAKKGGSATVREMLAGKVAGVKRMSDALKLLSDLADRALGTLAAEKHTNGREVVRFTLFARLSQTAQTQPDSVEA